MGSHWLVVVDDEGDSVSMTLLFTSLSGLTILLDNGHTKEYRIRFFRFPIRSDEIDGGCHRR